MKITSEEITMTLKELEEVVEKAIYESAEKFYNLGYTDGVATKTEK